MEKKNYLKPKMEEVFLVAGEAILGVCKASGDFNDCAGAGMGYDCGAEDPVS